MQRFVNNPDFIVDDMLKGLVKANPEVRFSEENDHVISMHPADNEQRTLLVEVVSRHLV